MSKQITGIHVFEKRREDEWNELSFAVQLLSILSWKKFHGRIELYTNEGHLADLKARGMDALYDKIDTKILKTAPELDESKYWSFNKLYVASKLKAPFVLIDTDLYIEEPLDFNEEMAFQGFHFESFNVDFPGNHYLDFDNSLPSKWIGRWNKELMPINTAILFMNNQQLIKEWYECALEIASQSNQIEVNDEVYSYYMTLVEQRLLPMLSSERGLKYSPLTSPIYLSYIDGSSGKEWWPPIETLSEDEIKKFTSIKHIWGLKRFIVDNKEMKVMISNVIEEAYNKYVETNNYLKLLEPWKESSQILTNQYSDHS